jgi:hypothetical protein
VCKVRVVDVRVQRAEVGAHDVRIGSWCRVSKDFRLVWSQPNSSHHITSITDEMLLAARGAVVAIARRHRAYAPASHHITPASRLLWTSTGGDDGW